MMNASTSRFSQLEVLQGIGQNLLSEFLAFFRADPAAKNIPLPDPQSPGDTYFAAVASLFASTLNFKPETPNSLKKALHAIGEMADPATAQTVAITLGQ